MNVTKAIIMFSGFQESEENKSGFEAGFFTTIRQFANGDVTVYHPRTWKTNVKNLLRQLYENGISQVAIISYSHGQAAAIDFAKLAPHYGVTIHLYLACDPIYRPTWAPRKTWAQIFSVRSVIGNPKIKVPPTIKQVYSVIQNISKPSGHHFIAIDPNETEVHIPVTIKLPHTRIDESPTWWSLVKLHLQSYVRQTH